MIKKLSAEILLAIEGKKKSRVLHKLSWIKFDLGKYIFISLVEKHAIPRTSSGQKFYSVERRTGTRAVPEDRLSPHGL